MVKDYYKDIDKEKEVKHKNLPLYGTIDECPSCATSAFSARFEYRWRSRDLSVINRVCAHCGYKWEERPLYFDV